ncbi:hypothetical protein CEXT_66441 [Caerostris extrusa]|uniref:G-protein coupled receptors family 2 profile 2 domain-containing protein n=1 Tax=Caerostris extrusa TaxID=172846 RepID=A0AAV4TJJ4_CAEEX|nr:hypothetical protein CEXT_66441 [Caerostris extrusa]
MLLEGVLLYRMVIQVFQTKKTRIFVLYIIAYGIPFVIVSLSSAMFRDEMIRKKYCWPSKEKGLIWSVLAPVLFIILINFIIFGLTLRAASKIDQFNVGTISFESKKKILRQRSKGLLSVPNPDGFQPTCKEQALRHLQGERGKILFCGGSYTN